MSLNTLLPIVWRIFFNLLTYAAVFRQKTILLLLATVCAACDESPLLKNQSTVMFNTPISSVEVPGADLALAVNANINLNEAEGSILPLQISTLTALPSDALRIPSLAGQVLLDTNHSLMFVSARARDAVLVYQYSVPGINKQKISFEAKTVEDPAVDFSNGIKADDEPFGMTLASATKYGDVLLALNSLSGSLTVIDTNTLRPVDLNPEDADLNGLRLFSAKTAAQKNQKPARGALHVKLVPSTNFAYVSMGTAPEIYVIDLLTMSVEALLDFSPMLGTSGGFRDFTFAANGDLLILYPRTGQLLTVDTSTITDNGIDQDVLLPKIKSSIYVGNSPEAIMIGNASDEVYVTLLRNNQVVKLNISNHAITHTILLDGVGPSHLLKLSSGNALVSEFFSNSISVLDTTNQTITGRIQ